MNELVCDTAVHVQLSNHKQNLEYLVIFLHTYSAILSYIAALQSRTVLVE
jgi:hypothetical protein